MYVSASSAPNSARRHALPLNPNPLRKADVMLLSSISPCKGSAKFDTMCGKMCRHIEATLKAGGKALIPIAFSGVFYEVVDAIFAQLRSMILAGTRVFVVSPVAKKALSYSSIMYEWACPTKQAQALLAANISVQSSGKGAASHEDLIKQGLLIPLADVEEKLPTHVESPSTSSRSLLDWNQPCVVLAGHHSLACGPALQLLQSWASRPENAVILTDPGSKIETLRKAVGDNPIQIIQSPVDARLTVQQVCELVSSVKPSHLVTLDNYLQPKIVRGRKAASALTAVRCPVVGLSPMTTADVPVPARFREAQLTSELASNIFTKRLVNEEGRTRAPSMGAHSGMSVAPVRALVCQLNGDITLRPLSDVQAKASAKQLYGSLRLVDFLQSLENHGVTDACVKTEATDHAVVAIPSLGASVTMRQGGAEITTNSEHARVLIQASVTCLLDAF